MPLSCHGAACCCLLLRVLRARVLRAARRALRVAMRCHAASVDAFRYTRHCCRQLCFVSFAFSPMLYFYAIDAAVSLIRRLRRCRYFRCHAAMPFCYAYYALSPSSFRYALRRRFSPPVISPDCICHAIRRRRLMMPPFSAIALSLLLILPPLTLIAAATDCHAADVSPQPPPLAAFDCCRLMPHAITLPRHTPPLAAIICLD